MLALQFLTLIPVRVRGDITGRDLAGSAAFFPVIGALQGLPAALVALLATDISSAGIGSGVAVFCLVLTNGGFHLDGLADTFDALGVKSTGDEAKDREKRRAVMKDSTSGAVGVTAIVLAILLQYVFMAHILSRAPMLTALAFLFLAPVAAKWTMVLSLWHGTPARNNGLGQTFAESLGAAQAVTATIFLVFFACLAAAAFLRTVAAIDLIGFFLSLAGLLCLFCLAASWFFRRRFGGMTGDNFGAINEISQILYLFWTTLWLPRFIL